MALNTAHANGGVLIHAGECILLFCDNVQMEFAGQVNTKYWPLMGMSCSSFTLRIQSKGLVVCCVTYL